MGLWKKYGADATCKECIASPSNGCCQGCSILGINGCTDKPMCCAVWTCNIIDKKHPELKGAMNKITQSMRGLMEPFIGMGFRKHQPGLKNMGIDTLVQIQGVE
jgi:hypothetical protein